MSAHLLLTLMSPAKTAERSEMPFRWVTLVGSRNHVWLSRSPKGKGQYLGVFQPIEKHCESLLWYKEKVKGFPYLLLSVWPGADPGV